MIKIICVLVKKKSVGQDYVCVGQDYVCVGQNFVCVLVKIMCVLVKTADWCRPLLVKNWPGDDDQADDQGSDHLGLVWSFMFTNMYNSMITWYVAFFDDRVDDQESNPGFCCFLYFVKPIEN